MNLSFQIPEKNKDKFFLIPYNYRYEKEGRFRKQVKAQKLWFAILDSQIETGTPYMLYKDACNEKSNQKVQYIQYIHRLHVFSVLVDYCKLIAHMLIQEVKVNTGNIILMVTMLIQYEHIWSWWIVGNHQCLDMMSMESQSWLKYALLQINTTFKFNHGKTRWFFSCISLVLQANIQIFTI